MVERGEQLGFALEAREPVAIEGEEFGQDFQRDVAIELRVARAIDLAHPACAEPGQNLVAADLPAAERPACILSHDLRRHLQRRGCEEPLGGAFVREQGFHFPPQGVIATARLCEEPASFVRVLCQGGVIELRDLRPAVRFHRMCSP